MSRTPAAAHRGTTTERCPSCKGIAARVDMTVDGAALTMVACSACDRRVWRRDGEPVNLRMLLADLSDRDLRFARMGRPEDRDDEVDAFVQGASAPGR